MRRVFRVAVYFALVLLVAAPAAAQDTGWVIKSFDVRLAVQSNADVLVTEDIAVDFGSIQKHGIYRDIPVLSSANSTQERRIRIEDVRVQGDPGTPDDLKVIDQGSTVRLRIGSPDRTVSGPHHYQLSYRVVGTMNAFDTHAELYWNVTGSQWSVPIERATVRITGPAAVTRVACYMGPTGSTARCPEAELQQDMGQASTGPLKPGEGMTVVAAFPPSSVQVPPPELVSGSGSPTWGHDDTRGASSSGHAATTVDFIFAAVLTALIGLGLTRFLLREGRDEAAPGPALHTIENRPPERLRPALLSLLINKRVSERDISATLVDLAVRGYLSIEQMPNPWWRSTSDWRLSRRFHRIEPPLAEYERVLLDSLFDTQDEVLVSKLKGKFSSEYSHVRNLIYAAPEAEGWFSEQVDDVRRKWWNRATLLAVGSFALTCVASNHQRNDLAVWLFPLVLGGIGLAWSSRWIPRRTAAGSAMLRRAMAFRDFILTAEQRSATLAREGDLFSELLPYAIAFGAEDRWSRVFSGLSTQALTRTPHGIWFIGATGAFSAIALSSALSDFGSHVGGSLASTPSSSSGFGSGSSGFGGGGFSGGGGGGGGGGGW